MCIDLPMTSMPLRKVLLIGWDAADWKVIRPLIRTGQMPTLAGLMRRGVWGNIATMHPVLSPMLWTSIATGKRPHQHGIHGFIEPVPPELMAQGGPGVRPSASTTRTCKAIWNILTQKGLKTHQVGWFCSHPAEPINGVNVSNVFEQVTARDPAQWTVPDAAVHPASLAETLGALRLHPSELNEQIVLPFMPKAAKIDQEKDHRLALFAKLFCEMVNIHSAATWIMEHEPWDFMGVYNPAIDHFSHSFMRYHPPRMEGVTEEEFEIYKDVIVGCYRFHDMMLDRYLQLAGDDVTVVLCSDHGFHSDHLRPRDTPREPTGPAVWHREYGIIVMQGPGIREGDRVYGASVLDMTPTILTLFGLPIGDDMDGKPLLQALDRAPAFPARIPSWEKIDGAAGMHPLNARQDPFADNASVQQLVELGYIDAPDENRVHAAANAQREATYNLARSLQDAGRIDDALTHAESLWEQHPQEVRFGIFLAQCYLGRRRYAEARTVTEHVLGQVTNDAVKHADRIDHRRDAVRQVLKTGRSTDGQIVVVEEGDATTSKETKDPSSGDPAEPRRYVTRAMLQRAERQMAAAAGRLRSLDVRITPTARLLLGILELHERHVDEALAHLERAEAEEPRLPGLHLQIGRVYLRLRRPADAARAFRKAIRIDGDNAMAHEGLATALLRLRRPTPAAEHALIAVGLLHHFPRAHFRLGVALTRLRMYSQAVEAFETCLKIAPRSVACHRWLARLYGRRLGREDLAAKHLGRIDFIRHAKDRPDGPSQ